MTAFFSGFGNTRQSAVSATAPAWTLAGSDRRNAHLPREKPYKRAVLWFFLGTLALVAVGLSGFLHWIVPAAAAALAYRLYRRAPLQYVAFVWWLWILSPLIRRVVDYRSGWLDPSPILLAPPLATLACFPTLIRRQSELWQSRARPFLLAFAATAYGFCIGILRLPIKPLLLASLGWSAPLIFGFFLYCAFQDERDTDEYVRMIQTTFRWGLVLVGGYGVLQLFSPPVWDQQWMINSAMASIGSPEPFKIRVFSTMNSPGPMATFLVAGLLLMISQRGLLVRTATVLGFCSLAFSMIRGAWVSLPLGLLLLAFRQRRLWGKVVSVALLLAGCFLLAQISDPINQIVQTRLDTMSNLQDDSSYQDRENGYRQYANTLLSEPFGVGLGANDVLAQSDNSGMGAHDNGLVEVLLSTGWFAGTAYLIALGMICKGFFATSRSHSLFYLAGCCISLVLVAELPLGSVTRDFAGILLWSFAGICMALRAISDKQSISFPAGSLLSASILTSE